MKSGIISIVSSAMLAVAFLATAGLSPAGAAAWRIEAERARDGDLIRPYPAPTYKSPTWKVLQAPDASAGGYLGGGIDGESHPVPVRIPHAGSYRIWVRHYATPGAFTSFTVLFRDEIGSVVDCHSLDFQPYLQTARQEPARTPAAPGTANAPAAAFVWSDYMAVFERPMDGALAFGSAWGLTGGKPGVDCVIISDDAAFDPRKVDLATLPVESTPKVAPAPPKGLHSAAVFDVNSAFFSGEPDPRLRYRMGIVNSPSLYVDYPWLVQLGINCDHGYFNGSTAYGISTMIFPGATLAGFGRETPAPIGRAANVEGKATGWSYSYMPYRQAYLKEMAENILLFKDWKEITQFRIQDESSGRFDYGDTAREAFHRWLAGRYGAIDKLNALWRTTYADFAQIPLPTTPKETDNKAPWFAFREFSGLEWVNFVAEQARVVREVDPAHRPCASQASCLSLNSPYFTLNGPMDIEDLIDIGFAGESEFGVDAYSTQDTYVGCDMSLLLSLMNGRRLFNEEFNVHGQDPRQMARAVWGQIGIGVRGITTYMMQDAPNYWVYDMWSLMDADHTPRPRLAALADANHEVRRLERLLAPATTRRAVKPIALYYSRLDLSLPQPTLGIYSGALDSPYRIYNLLRGLGYPVRWITPRQIEADGLADVGAVVMVGVKYVPGAAAAKLAQWVRDGGSLIGDQWPGALDEYDRPQAALLETFGIRPEATGSMDPNRAKEVVTGSTTPVAGGIDPEALRALSREELFQTVEEMWDQWDSRHPVARAAGKWHLSGFDLKKITVISGEILGMAMSGGRPGRPAVTINAPGKGHTLYFASMLGTLYEAGPLAAEWDSAVEGTGLSRLLGGYLRFCGLQPQSVAGMPERMALKMRVESPLADARGNAVFCMTSNNDGPLSPFPLAVRWPEASPSPKLVLTCTGGSRQMRKLPFELKDGSLHVTMPDFDTHGALLALTDSDPLISLEVTGADRNVAGLLDVAPGMRLKVKATIWNPSPRVLAAGIVRLYAAPGWFSDRQTGKVGAIGAYGSRTVSFEVAAPALCAKRTLRPIVLKYASGNTTSPPATELVWWGQPAE